MGETGQKLQKGRRKFGVMLGYDDDVDGLAHEIEKEAKKIVEHLGGKIVRGDKLPRDVDMHIDVRDVVEEAKVHVTVKLTVPQEKGDDEVEPIVWAALHNEARGRHWLLIQLRVELRAYLLSKLSK